MSTVKNEQAMQKRSISSEIGTILRDVGKNWWPILLIAISAALALYVYLGRDYVKTYTVKATYIVSEQDAKIASQNLQAASETASQFTQIISSSVMKKTVMEDLKISSFDANVAATVIENTNLLNLTVTSKSPEYSFKILNSIMRNYSTISQYIVGDYIMEVLQDATIPEGPDTLFRPYKAMVKMFILVVVALILIIAVLSIFRDTVRSGADVEHKLDARLIGEILHEKKYKTIFAKLKKQRYDMLYNSPTSSFMYTENIKKVETKIKNRMDREGAKVLIVSSVLENEGKTMTASNVALALAEDSANVALLDCDFRKPALYKVFEKNKEEIHNLGDVLKGNADMEKLLEKGHNTDLSISYNTMVMNDSTELITNGKFEELLNFLRERMDYIVLDSAPMGMVADTEELAAFADASILVVRQHTAEAKYINDKIASLMECKAKFLGVVLNDVHKNFSNTLDIGANYYGYGKRYGRDED